MTREQEGWWFAAKFFDPAKGLRLGVAEKKHPSSNIIKFDVLLVACKETRSSVPGVVLLAPGWGDVLKRHSWSVKIHDVKQSVKS